VRAPAPNRPAQATRAPPPTVSRPAARSTPAPIAPPAPTAPPAAAAPPATIVAPAPALAPAAEKRTVAPAAAPTAAPPSPARRPSPPPRVLRAPEPPAPPPADPEPTLPELAEPLDGALPPSDLSIVEWSGTDLPQRTETTAEIAQQLLEMVESNDIPTLQPVEDNVPPPSSAAPVVFTGAPAEEEPLALASEPRERHTASPAPAPPTAAAATARVERRAPATQPTGRSPDAEADEASARPSNQLQVCELVKLRPGGRSRRFEVIMDRRAPSSPMRGANRADQRVEAPAMILEELIEWRREQRDSGEGLSFTINLSGPALAADHVLQRLADQLRALGTEEAADFGFDVQESLCVREKTRVARFISQCERVGCFWVLDDFSFDSAALPLLRSSALRLVKVDPKLTAAVLHDKLAQARVIAVAQAARVLGVHCSAKQVDGQTLRRWLTGAGFDSAQGSLFRGFHPLASLGEPAEPDA
jgi:EAL domain-containing protein (putative c-di-GMP-specific phosphodiesterase class I)